MPSLKDKYRGWAAVHSGSKSYLGLIVDGTLAVGNVVTLKPCFELDHQVHLQDRGPQQSPGAGFVPLVKPPDLCLTADVSIRTGVDSFMEIDALDEDIIAWYDEIILSVVAQFEHKRKAIRQARSGIIPNAPANFDPSKFKSGAS